MVNKSPTIINRAYNSHFRSEKDFNAEMGIVNATSNNYKDLANKPSINGVVLEGDKTSSELNIIEDKNYIHYQRIAAETWKVEHNLDKFPSVTIVDSAESTVVGEVTYIDENNLTVEFASAFSGKAICN